MIERVGLTIYRGKRRGSSRGVCLSVRSKANAQAALTLIELIVVLIILVGLGGLLVPAISNALTRTHVSTCLANFPEVTSMLVRSEVISGSYGDGWTNPMASGDFALKGTLTTDEIASLAAVGMINFTEIDPSVPDYNVTFNNGVTSGNGSPLTTSDAVVLLDGATANELFLPTVGSERYVFFAIDKSWSLLGTLAPEPPVHFGDTPGALPDEAYSRFGGVFQVADAAGNPLSVARFRRVTVHVGSEFETADNHAAIYWDKVAGKP